MSDDEKEYGVWTSPAGLRLVAPSKAAEVEQAEAEEKEYARDNPMAYFKRAQPEVNDNDPPDPITNSDLPWYLQQNPMEFFKGGEQLEIERYIEWATRHRDKDSDIDV